MKGGFSLGKKVLEVHISYLCTRPCSVACDDSICRSSYTMMSSQGISMYVETINMGPTGCSVCPQGWEDSALRFS